MPLHSAHCSPYLCVQSSTRPTQRGSAAGLPSRTGGGQCQGPAQDTGNSRIYRWSLLRLIIKRNKRHRIHPPVSKISAVPKPAPSVSCTCSRSQKGVCTALLSSHLNVLLICSARGRSWQNIRQILYKLLLQFPKKSTTLCTVGWKGEELRFRYGADHIYNINPSYCPLRSYMVPLVNLFFFFFLSQENKRNSGINPELFHSSGYQICSLSLGFWMKHSMENQMELWLFCEQDYLTWLLKIAGN